MWPAPIPVIPRKKTITTETDTEKNTPTVRGETSQETEEMKGCSQTRLRADISMADLLTPKQQIQVGLWNVRTLREMTNYKVEILCVSESRWTDSGRRILASGHHIILRPHSQPIEVESQSL